MARKRLDIGPVDLLRGAWSCVRPPARAVAERRVAASWTPAAAAVPCFSARSGLDLVLAAATWPPGSEVLLSAISIPHLPVIVRAHGYVPVVVDVDPRTLRPDPAEVDRAVTPRTRALLHAQLLGARDDLGDLAAVARRRGLLLVEDRAQSYDGRDRALGPHADVVLHSCGTIKTLTCLGGGVLLVRDPQLRARVREVHGGWPVQSASSYAARLARGALVLAVGHPRAYPHLVRSVEALGGDLDAVLRRWSRGFADDDLLRQLRHRPGAALLAVMAHRFERDHADRVQRRARAGERLAGALGPHVRQLGGRASRRTHWLFAVVVEDPEALVAAGRAAGFDLTRGSSALVALDPGCVRAGAAMAGVVHLPVSEHLGDAQIDALAAVVSTAAPAPGASGAGAPRRGS